jgi:hypothetical protein
VESSVGEQISQSTEFRKTDLTSVLRDASNLSSIALWGALINKSNSKEIVNEYGDSNGVITPHNGQDFLIDVTSSVNEDEYLKTALSVADNHHSFRRNNNGTNL